MGFAFVQMSNKGEAGMALKALNGASLAGGERWIERQIKRERERERERERK